jgi:glycosyltransferase involved in cell wall biosynthesis
VRAVFVFQNSRAQLVAGVARRTEPDSTLWGANHLAEHGIEARVHDALLTRRALRPPIDRLAWNARELTLPFEFGRADVAFTPLANLFPLTAAARGLPVIVINYGLNLILKRAGRARRMLLSRSLHTAARVICLGESQRLELIELIDLSPERVMTMGHSIDDRFFEPVDAPAGANPVVSVGKDLGRDYATFVEAVSPLQVPVDIAADRRNVAGIRLPPNVRSRFYSALELRDLYARAACVVLPQHPDGYPYGTESGGLTALFEAMAMGKAVVATHRAVIDEYVEDGVDGILVPPSDPEAMRSAVERLLGDAELRSRLGAAGRARVERDHTSRGFAALLAPVLRDVVYPRSS